MEHWWALWAERIARLLADRWRHERAGNRAGDEREPDAPPGAGAEPTDTSAPPGPRAARDPGGGA